MESPGTPPPTPTPVTEHDRYARIAGTFLETDPYLPEIHGVLKNVSDVMLNRVRIAGTFYVGDRAADRTNMSERDMTPGEEREFLIRYFRGDDSGLVEVIEVYL